MVGRHSRHVGEAACEWLMQNSSCWERSPPEWYTAEWRAVVRERVRFLGTNGPPVVAMMRCDGEEEGEGDVHA